MIAVIADDFTGAAEIGGIGLRHGLRVMIETEAIRHPEVDLLIIATDTRSMKQDEAVRVVRNITQGLMNMKPKFIYKKVDSVLRGNVYAELTAQLQVSGLSKAVVVAANPVFKRVIRDGIYYIDNVPLHQTHFAKDPDFPVGSSSVRDIIGEGEIPLVTSVKALEVMPREGIIIGDVSSFDDLDNWCVQIDEHTIPAGASGFFNTFLFRKHLYKQYSSADFTPFQEKALYVLGSSYPKDENFVFMLQEKGMYLSNMPEEMYFNRNHDPSLLSQWVEDVIDGMRSCRKVVVAVPYRHSQETGISNRIKECYGQLIKQVVDRCEIGELLIEGGSTTSVVLNHLNVKKLCPVQELETGIIRMKIDGFSGMYLTTKPGSYNWPDNVWINQDLNYLKTMNKP